MNISWLVDKRVIFVDIGISLTMTDLIEMNEKIIELLDAGDAKVHIIFRATELVSFPVTFSSLSKVFSFVTHPKLGWDITINNNRLLSFISAMVNRAINRRATKYVDTYEDAKELLQRIDPSLPDLPDSLE